MTKKEQRIPDYLEHILTAISQIKKYSLGLDQKSFIEHDMAQDAIIRRFEIIGEAAHRILLIDSEFTKTYPGLDLDVAYRMRNALAHGYETVNLRIVWETMQQKLPILESEATRVLRILSAS